MDYRGQRVDLDQGTLNQWECPVELIQSSIPISTSIAASGLLKHPILVMFYYNKFVEGVQNKDMCVIPQTKGRA
jgi:hypothetical protein